MAASVMRSWRRYANTDSLKSLPLVLPSLPEPWALASDFPHYAFLLETLYCRVHYLFPDESLLAGWFSYCKLEMLFM